MASIDMVEKLRERANVSYEEAKTALEACDDDLLEALIYLEKQGKVSSPAGGSYSSKTESRENQTAGIQPPNEKKGESFSEMLNRFFRWCGKIINKGNTNYFEVLRHDQKILNVPITILILLLICAFWVTLPLMVIGLFFSCRYKFKGPEVQSINVNSVMDSAANAADNLKNEVISAQHNHNNDQK